MTASIQTTASADTAERLEAYAREVTGLNPEVAVQGLAYTNTFASHLSFTVTLPLDKEQAAELNKYLGLG
ncbi:hypothetical protein [Pseudoclavibacter sp. VKM Ac-2888]|uniref:hypothetical protein n=1 Tax=Pseudoclavibacter sp. VKM Ac-2888 TaxID=2783830 RepID=UPI00188AF631|nr:hypothetical protein [Pseudoclavibacter sp. VKM Ac-2888]MBF4549683.1 hypothetical protein [Pseudoclavibacter sp. VKM Ac-2888]